MFTDGVVIDGRPHANPTDGMLGRIVIFIIST